MPPEDLSTIDGGLAALLTEAWGQGILSAESLRGVLDDLRDGTRSTEYYVGIYQDRLLQAAMPQQDRLLSRRERRRLEVDARIAKLDEEAAAMEAKAQAAKLAWLRSQGELAIRNEPERGPEPGAGPNPDP